MRPYIILLVLSLFVGCAKQSSSKAADEHRAMIDKFFVDWLKSHGHTNVVVDSNGVGISDNDTRLQGSLYGSNKHESRGYVVEVEFTIRLPSQGEITEFLAGMGDTEEQAINDALLNFTLTTFHVVYKAFMNADDPHMTTTSVPFNGGNRDVIAGDILMRGAKSLETTNIDNVRVEILAALASTPLAPGSHWTKIVYSQDEGKPMTVAVTLDNEDHPALTSQVTNLNWPKVEGFYMAKQFIVIK
jgi:hypothetical protein